MASGMQFAADGILICDTQGNIMALNPAFERLFECQGEDLRGHNVRALNHGHSLALPEELPAMRPGETWCGQTIHRRQGTATRVEVTVTAVPDHAGGVRHFVITTRDVAHEVELEERLRQAQKMEAIGRLAGGVAHDFNNLLTAILGYSDLVLRQLPANNPSHGFIEEVKKAGDRAVALTRQLLAFSRKQIVEPKVVDLNVLVANMRKMLRRLISENVDLLTVTAVKLGRVKADPGQVEQVIVNLAINAHDAMPDGGKLTIETANMDLDETYASRHPGLRPGAYVMLAVSDTGSGMDAKTQARIFEPFFTTKEHGTGLGLATVHGIVEQCTGNIAVYSDVGIGTCFKVYFPRVDEAAIDEDGDSDECLRGTETILFVEDNDDVRGLASEVLRMNGYQVIECRNGESAVRLASARNERIHLVISDLVMTGMSGREAYYRVVTRHPETRVLFISGYTDNTITRHGVLDSRAAFLQKPFTPQVLSRKVREVLDGS